MAVIEVECLTVRFGGVTASTTCHSRLGLMLAWPTGIHGEPRALKRYISIKRRRG